MEMYNSPEGEQDPDAVFQGLGLRGWLRLVLRTRAGTIKQCDRVTDQLFERINSAYAETKMVKAAIARMAAVMIKQHDALVLAEAQLKEDDAYGEERQVAHKAIVDALAAAQTEL